MYVRIHTPGGADGSCGAAPELLELGDIVLDPSEASGMREIDSSLSHHFH
jgi:hypothetical protein